MNTIQIKKIIMVIIGAKGFAKELIQVIFDNGELSSNICFFDDISNDLPMKLFDTFRIIRNFEELREYFIRNSNEFTLGIGTPSLRNELSKKAIDVGGKLTSIISKTSSIGHYGTVLGEGLSIMRNSIIENDVIIGDGCLIHNGAIISHDTHVGVYCEISPGAKLLGRTFVGDFCQIGSNAVLLPGLKLGNKVRVGAGAVVTKDVPDHTVVVGVPAEEVRKI